MKSRAPELLDRLIPAACTELFAAYGVSLRRLSVQTSLPEETPEASTGGLVNFASDQMSGSILLVSTFRFMAECRPAELRSKPLAMSSSADWILVRDWTMELCESAPRADSQPALRLQSAARDEESDRSIRPFARRRLAFAHPGAVRVRYARQSERPRLVRRKVQLGVRARNRCEIRAALPKEGDVILF